MGKAVKIGGLIILAVALLGYWHYFSHFVPVQYHSWSHLVIILLVALLVFYLIAMPGKTQRQKINNLQEDLIRKKLKAMEALANEEGENYTALAKVKKFNFNQQQIESLETKPEQLSQDKDNEKIDIPQKNSSSATLNFEMLQEFDWILPSIQGTYEEFTKAVEKFSDILSIFISDEEERELIELLEQRQYTELVERLEQHTYIYQKQSAVAALLESKHISYLQYGRFLGSEKEDSNFIVDRFNLKLYKEVYCLLQELFLRYVNEQKKTDCHSLDDLLENIAWEEIENLQFSKDIKIFGRDIMDVLVEDFLNSLKPMKQKSLTEYRSLRMVLRHIDTKSPIETGYTVNKIILIIKETYQKIQQNIAVQTPEEITQLVKASQIDSPIALKSQLKDHVCFDGDEEQEKQLCERLFAINKFLRWYPQDLSLITQKDQSLLDYFDRLLYSRRRRLAIVRDEGQAAEKKVWDARIEQILSKLKDAEKKLEELEASNKGDLIGAKIEIVPPRQCEDYFPLQGIVESVIKQPIDGGNIIKLEIVEPNHLRSYVVFTGNNINII